MNYRKFGYGVLVLGIALAWFGGCSTTNGTNSNNGPGNPSGSGICEETCPKACSSDQDCQTSTGELCCPSGNVCVNAKGCPTVCADDSKCNTMAGQACVRTSLANTETTCEPANVGLKFCQVDTDCPGTNQVCCGIYNKKICLAANQCPNACTKSSDCNTTQGEICCTSAPMVEPSLTAQGLCLDPTTEPCPKACTTSSDCVGNSNAALCCSGICQATCPKSCEQDSDCTGMICCKTKITNVPIPPHVFKVAPSCQGTPVYTSCASCSTVNGCSCPGCGVEAGAGVCSGTPNYSTCASCPSSYCATTRCAGCTSAAGSCTGTPTYSTCASCPSTYCGNSTYNYCKGCTMTGGSCTGTVGSGTGCSYFTNVSQANCSMAGCTWAGSSTVTGTCSGTPSACSTFGSTNCSSLGCTLSTGTCTGTVTPCAQLLDATSCAGQYNCTWSGACTGTPTSCVQLSDLTSCQNQGCFWSSTGSSSCVGTITPCSQLSATQCRNQPGCTFM